MNIPRTSGKPISTGKIRAKIKQWEYEKPLLVLWTKHDEERLQVYKELLAYREKE